MQNGTAPPPVPRSAIHCPCAAWKIWCPLQSPARLLVTLCELVKVAAIRSLPLDELTSAATSNHPWARVLFLESIFIDQATLNGTRPNSPIGDKPATASSTTPTSTLATGPRPQTTCIRRTTTIRDVTRRSCATLLGQWTATEGHHSSNNWPRAGRVSSPAAHSLSLTESTGG